MPTKSSGRKKTADEFGDSLVSFHKSKYSLIKMFDLVKSVQEYKESLVKNNIIDEEEESKMKSKSSSSVETPSKSSPKKKSPTTTSNTKTNNHTYNHEKVTKYKTNESTTATLSKNPASKGNQPAYKSSNKKYSDLKGTLPSKPSSKPTTKGVINQDGTISEISSDSSKKKSISSITVPQVAIPKQIFQVQSASGNKETETVSDSKSTSGTSNVSTKDCSTFKPESFHQTMKQKVKDLSGNDEAFNNPFSPQSKALNWVFSNSNNMLQQNKNDGSSTICPDDLIQRYAIVTLYYSLGGENWNNKSDFLIQNKDECKWGSKIRCNDQNEIVEIIIGKQIQFRSCN